MNERITYGLILQKIRQNGYYVISFNSYDNMPAKEYFELELQGLGAKKSLCAIYEHYLITV
jgi:hypothetical protein